MIERVARAGFAQAEKNGRLSGYSGPPMKWETESDKLHEDWMAVARVMIEAMREPTEDMINATKWTEAMVEQIAERLFCALVGNATWARSNPETREWWVKQTRAALAAIAQQ